MITRFFALLSTACCVFAVVVGAHATELPIATTVPLTGVPGLPGMVVRYDEATQTYAVAEEALDPGVYGVIGERPAIVFVTASSAAPIVTTGVTGVLVDAGASGPIVRGDVLTTSNARGVAMRAPLETDAVFAVALEDAPQGQRLIRAEVNVEKAKAVQASKRAAAADALGPSMTTTFVRTAIAAVFALGALGFLLYSFKTIANTSVVSIGRNPRARATVIATAAASFVAAVALAILVVLIAIGVLVLPV